MSNYASLYKNTQPYIDVCALINKGFLSDKIVKKIEHPDTLHLSHLVNRCMNQLVLETTKACNFTCRYCHQPALYSQSTSSMSVEMGLKSVDFLLEHSKDAQSIAITFYGGEPLLNLKLIKATVEYANKKFQSKPVSYNMTTNASLLNDDIIDYLIKHNFSVLVSLDGGADVQNYHRKFTKDGGNTFDIVWANVIRIRDKNPEYFNEQIRFNSVVLPGESYDSVVDFFVKQGVSKTSVTTREADLSGIDYNQIPNTITENKSDKIDFDEDFEDMIKYLAPKKRTYDKWHHNGPCVPAVKRLFVNVDGEFFPCEKLNNDKACMIGNLNSGLDLKQIDCILNVARITEQECTECWALKLCSMCIKDCVNNGKISYDKKRLVCQKNKNDAIIFLKEYIQSKKLKGGV